VSLNGLTDDALRQSGEYTAAVQNIPSGANDAQLKEKGKLAEATESDQVTNALSMLIKFIPTEVITLYIATLAALPLLQTQWSFISRYNVYVFFVVLAPILLVVIYLGKRKTAGSLSLLPTSLKEWPIWKMIASAIAFSVWALAVPENGLLEGDVGGAIGAFLAIFISTLLSVFDPLLTVDTTK
jgi:hypothetical protein